MRNYSVNEYISNNRTGRRYLGFCLNGKYYPVIEHINNKHFNNADFCNVSRAMGTYIFDKKPIDILPLEVEGYSYSEFDGFAKEIEGAIDNYIDLTKRDSLYDALSTIDCIIKDLTYCLPRVFEYLKEQRDDIVDEIKEEEK